MKDKLVSQGNKTRFLYFCTTNQPRELLLAA